MQVHAQQSTFTVYELLKLLHLAAAVIWLGGMAFVLIALRPVAIVQLPPPARLKLLAAVMGRFFIAVWVSIGTLLLTGGTMLASVNMAQAPLGVHLMLAIAVLMIVVFTWLYSAPYQRLLTAVGADDWPQAGRQMARIHPLVVLNFVLGCLAVVAVYLLR